MRDSLSHLDDLLLDHDSSDVRRVSDIQNIVTGDPEH